MTSQSAFVTTVDPQEVGVRNFKKLETSRGAYLNVTYSGKKLYLVLGTKEKPLTTPLGVKNFADWTSLSVALDEEATKQVDAVDTAILNILSDNSKELFHVKLSAEQLQSLGYYQSMLYAKEGLDPLFGGKVVDDVQIVGASNEPLDIAKEQLHDHIPAGSLVRAVVKIESLFFPTMNSCKVLTKVAKIQIVEAADPAEDLNSFQF